MIETIVLHEIEDPYYKEEHEPRCPKCGSIAVFEYKDKRLKSWRHMCRECKFKGYNDEF